jgi:hypothetical protein
MFVYRGVIMTIQISSSFSNVDRMYEIPSGVRISHPSDLREGQSYAVAPREKYAAVEYKVPNAGPVVKFRFLPPLKAINSVN